MTSGFLLWLPDVEQVGEGSRWSSLGGFRASIHARS